MTMVLVSVLFYMDFNLYQIGMTISLYIAYVSPSVNVQSIL